MGTNRRAAATVAVATVLLATAACGSQDKPQVKLGAEATPPRRPRTRVDQTS